MKKVAQYYCFLLSLFNCSSNSQDISYSETTLQTIAIGSCNRQDAPQDYWSVIRSHGPDLWIWLGDNVYSSDTDDDNMSVLKAQYDLQKNNAAYQALLASQETKVIGIWDDHDYGRNDAGSEYPYKSASRDLLFDFLDVPRENPAWCRNGGYQSYVFGSGDYKVKVILLDARYFRSELLKDSNGAYQNNTWGTILGETQWEWLEEELTTNNDSDDAALHLIASGIQFIAQEHRFEKWANFPNERQRMMDLIAKTKPKKALFLSGDRHISEIASIPIPGYGSLYDFTSSGLTHSYESSTESNSHRMGKLITEKSFGLIQIDWSDADNGPKVSLEMRGMDGDLLDSPKVLFDK